MRDISKSALSLAETSFDEGVESLRLNNKEGAYFHLGEIGGILSMVIEMLEEEIHNEIAEKYWGRLLEMIEGRIPYKQPTVLAGIRTKKRRK